MLFLDNLSIYLKYRPNIVVTFGSYVSLIPILFYIFLKPIFYNKLYFMEQNSVLGKVHKIFQFAAENIFISFKLTQGISKKNRKKIIYSGLPIRVNNKILKPKKNTKKINILLFGGSQGSLNMSTNVAKLLASLPEKYRKKIFLNIQTTKNNINNVKNILKNSLIEFNVSTFFKDIESMINRSKFCICRSGSSTINELIMNKKPAILIPLPTASSNHQYLNAKFLSNRKSALIISEDKILTKKTKKIFEKILSNQNLLDSMKKTFKDIKILDSNKIIYEKIFK